MRSLTIIISGRPVPKARPRVTSHGTYTPQRTRTQTELVQAYARQTMQGLPPMQGSIELKVFYYLKGETRKRPDILNLDMLVADALTGIVYEDDSQIVTMISFKLQDKEERTVIEIREVA